MGSSHRRDASVVEAWDEVAPLYGAGSSPFRQFAERLAAWADVAEGERVVDLGCGNGLGLAALLDGASRRLTGVDFSPAMLAAARARLSSAPGVPAAPVSLVRADVGSLPFPDRAFDVAVASSVFQFVGYAEEVLREWRRVLAPGGRLALSIPSGVPDAGVDVNVTLLTEFFGRLPAEAQRRLQQRPRVPAHPPDLDAVCRAAGFASVEVADVEFVTSVPSRDDWWRLQWTHGFRGFLREFDEATLDEIKARAFALLGPRVTGTGAVEGRAVFRFVRAT